MGQHIASQHRVRFTAKEKRTVAMNPEVFQRLIVVADLEKRSLSAQMEAFIEESLDRWEAQDGPAQRKARISK